MTGGKPEVYEKDPVKRDLQKQKVATKKKTYEQAVKVLTDKVKP